MHFGQERRAEIRAGRYSKEDPVVFVEPKNHHSLHFKILRKQWMREMSHLQLEKEFLIAEFQVIDW